MEVELESERQQGAHEVGGRALGGQARPHPRGEVVAPWPSSFEGIFHIF